MTEEMIAWFDLEDAVAYLRISPMHFICLVENHLGRLMSDNYVGIVGNQFLWMDIAQPEKLHSINLHTPVLKEIHILWQVLNIVGIPQAHVMVACHEDFMLIGQIDEPVEEVEYLVLCAVMAEVARSLI